jgi:ribosomal protein L40E
MYNIARYTYLLDAQLDQLKLSQYGVESFIADEYMVSMQWFYTDAIGGIRLQVFDSDVEKAIEVFKLPEVDTSGATQCHQCDSTDTFRMKMSFWSFPLYLVGVFFPIPANKFICMSCGAKSALKNQL